MYHLIQWAGTDEVSHTTFDRILELMAHLGNDYERNQFIIIKGGEKYEVPPSQYEQDEQKRRKQYRIACAQQAEAVRAASPFPSDHPIEE